MNRQLEKIYDNPSLKSITPYIINYVHWALLFVVRKCLGNSISNRGFNCIPWTNVKFLDHVISSWAYPLLNLPSVFIPLGYISTYEDILIQKHYKLYYQTTLSPTKGFSVYCPMAWRKKRIRWSLLAHCHNC